jgi:hypothetical protein
MKKSDTTIAEFVLQEFIDNPHKQMTAYEVSKNLGIKPGAASNCIYNLIKQNRIFKVEYGKYQLCLSGAPITPTYECDKDDKSVEYDIILIKIITRSTYKYRSKEILEHIKDVLDEKNESVKIERVRAAENDEFNEIKVVRLK